VKFYRHHVELYFFFLIRLQRDSFYHFTFQSSDLRRSIELDRESVAWRFNFFYLLPFPFLMRFYVRPEIRNTLSSSKSAGHPGVIVQHRFSSADGPQSRQGSITACRIFSLLFVASMQINRIRCHGDGGDLMTSG
jgi:hypothetical protein